MALGSRLKTPHPDPRSEHLLDPALLKIGRLIETKLLVEDRTGLRPQPFEDLPTSLQFTLEKEYQRRKVCSLLLRFPQVNNRLVAEDSPKVA